MPVLSDQHLENLNQKKNLKPRGNPTSYDLENTFKNSQQARLNEIHFGQASGNLPVPFRRVKPSMRDQNSKDEQKRPF